MKLQRMTPAQYEVGKWSGGTTVQLAIFPREASYKDRAFLWRISSAAVELESSQFTPLPDYDRFISVLQGEMALSHDNGPYFRLAPYEVHAFDGGTDTRSKGSCTDFNLMVRKGACKGDLQSLRLEAEETAAVTALSPDAQIVICCVQGAAVVGAGEETVDICAQESVFVPQGMPQAKVTGTGPAVFMIAQMWPHKNT